jgi:AraC family transcriptional regulator
VLRRPTSTRHERGTLRALSFVQDHLAEPLSLPRVAKIAGFSASHFARLLKRKAGVSFSHYLQSLRIEHAKQMLTGTSFTVEQVQKRSGFRSATHFHRAFKRRVGATPAAYRERQRGKPIYPWHFPAPRRKRG